MEKSGVLAAIAGMCGSLGAVSGKLAFDDKINQITASSCILVFVISNIAMWASYTRSLALSESTSTPLVINIAFNFAMTGILGSLIFNESHSYTWWMLLSMLIVGLTMLLDGKPSDPKED